MALSRTEQDIIQHKINVSDDEERFKIESYSKSVLAEINTMISVRKLTPEERKASDIAIENLVRLDATKKGKGAWHRMKKRFSLTSLYLG
jgi:hypothetical protein